MKKNLLILFGVTALASPVAPRGCATVSVGLSWRDEHGTTASVTRSIDRNSGRPAHWDILVSGDGKQIKPLH